MARIEAMVSATGVVERDSDTTVAGTDPTTCTTPATAVLIGVTAFEARETGAVTGATPIGPGPLESDAATVESDAATVESDAATVESDAESDAAIVESDAESDAAIVESDAAAFRSDAAGRAPS